MLNCQVSAHQVAYVYGENEVTSMNHITLVYPETANKGLSGEVAERRGRMNSGDARGRVLSAKFMPCGGGR